MAKEQVDVGRYLRATLPPQAVTMRRGVYAFNCPTCRESKHRGWISPKTWAMGCFNVGCSSSPRAWGGFLEFVKIQEKLRGRGEALMFLKENFPSEGEDETDDFVRPVLEDFMRLPNGVPLTKSTRDGRQALLFIGRQWGLSERDAERWELRACIEGRFAGRVIIPVKDHGEIVAFQARTYVNGKPKYLTSRHGLKSNPEADCGRYIGDCLFNIDAVNVGDVILLVEGPGDVMRWEKDHPTHGKQGDPVGVGIMGMAFTQRREALILEHQPSSAIVALDAEEAVEGNVLSIYSQLEVWRIPTTRGIWNGAKDAGDGAVLSTRAMTVSPFQAFLQQRLRSSSGFRQ